MYSCHSVVECYNLFSGVKLSIRSFCFISDTLHAARKAFKKSKSSERSR